MSCPYEYCYYFKGCNQYSKFHNPIIEYEISPPDCFGCKLISENIVCPPNWRILKKNGKYCIQRKDRLWIFSKWTYLRNYYNNRILFFKTAYEAYQKIEIIILNEISRQKAKEKQKQLRKFWKKENGVVCGDK